MICANLINQSKYVIVSINTISVLSVLSLQRTDLQLVPSKAVFELTVLTPLMYGFLPIGKFDG